jgi:phosphatidate cytidylyltransferase
VIIFLIFFPLLFVIIFLVPFLHHIIFNVLVTTVILVAAFEMRNMFDKKGVHTYRVLAPLAAGTLPVIAFLEETALVPNGVFLYWVTGLLGLFLILTVFVTREEHLEEKLPLLSSSVTIFLVPAFFLSFFIRITSLPHPQIALLYMILPVFLNDIFAYLAGKLARGWSRLDMVISPNKSLIGFIAGIIASMATFLMLSLLLPSYYVISWPAAVLLGLVMGLTGIIGDLFESALKRSSGIKDSGVVMGGRGGILDAIDSMILSAPVFYLLFPLMATPVTA